MTLPSFYIYISKRFLSFLPLSLSSEFILSFLWDASTCPTYLSLLYFFTLTVSYLRLSRELVWNTISSELVLCRHSSILKTETVLSYEGKGKFLPQQAEVAQGVPVSLKSQIFLTFGTARVVGRQPYVPAAFTPGEIRGIHF